MLKPKEKIRRWMAREMERLFQHFKVKLSQTFFLGNFLGSETPEADPEPRIHVQMIQKYSQGKMVRLVTVVWLVRGRKNQSPRAFWLSVHVRPGQLQ